VQTESPIQCIEPFEQFSPAHAQLAHPMQTALSTLSTLPVPGMMTMMPPTMPSSMYALASKYPHYATPTPNLGDYAKWAPLIIGDRYVSAYGNMNHVNFEAGEQKDFDQFDAGFEFGRSARFDRATELCRNGDRCRFFLNPHISGPCHFYHPPSTMNTGPEMCATVSTKRRGRRNRAKHF